MCFYISFLISLKENGRPWFLKKDPKYEITYNVEGSVNGGTFTSLIERLTIHDQPIG